MGTKLYIPKPCHEDWNKMTQTEQGKHCSVCNKVVKDLTGLNKLQTMQIVANNKGENVCGRVNAEILDVYPTLYTKLGKAFRKLQIQLISLLGLFILDKKTVMSQNLSVEKNESKNENKKFSNKKMTLCVKVEATKGEPVSFANVVMIGKNGVQKATICDIDGIASIGFIESEMEGSEVSVKAFCIGFESSTIEKMYLVKDSSQMLIILNGAVVNLPEYSVRDYKVVTSGYMVIQRTETVGAMYMYTNGGYEKDSTINVSKTYPEEPLAFKAYPDPTDGVFTIECNRATVFDLQIFDNTGKMLSAIFQIVGRKEIDLGGYSAGVYYVNIMENGKLLDSKKIILSK